MSRFIMTNLTDDEDPDMQPALTCHVEIDNQSCDTSQAINSTTAGALRDLADQIEAGKLDTGSHPVKTPSGKQIGEVYLDYYAIMVD